MIAAMLALVSPAQADPVKGEAALAVSDGYARLLLKLDEDVDHEVSVAGAILIVRFKRPVDIAVGQLAGAAPDYVGLARVDPDGAAIRLSLSQKVTVNAMTAGERIFVDLLPESWRGLPPGLPPEVVRELSERARNAERALRAQRAVSQVKKRDPVRVRASVMPTFVRLAFEMPDNVAVSSALGEGKLALSFSAPLTFDLADARLAAPASIGGLSQRIAGDSAAVEIALIGDADVRAFREDKTYIVDIGGIRSDKPAIPPLPAPRPAAALSPPVPALDQKPAAPLPEAAAKPAPPEPSRPEPSKPESTKPESTKSEPAAPASPPRAEAAPPAPVTPAPARSADAVAVKRASDGLHVTFTFPEPTPAAMIRRNGEAWLIFDSAAPIDVGGLRGVDAAPIADASVRPLDGGQAVRIRLSRPQFASLTDDNGGQSWDVIFADSVEAPSQPLAVQRNVANPAQASVTVQMPGAGRLHRLVDPAIGDPLAVVTALPPARGMTRRQDFVEFALPETVHGVAIQANADDLGIDVTPDKVVMTRPGGLTLSSAEAGAQRATAAMRVLFDAAEWQRNRDADFKPRLDELMAASGGGAAKTRLDLARFYMARGLYYEAKSVLDLVLADGKPGQRDSIALIMHALASSLIDRPELALKDLADPSIGPSTDTQLWKAMALARQGKWPEAREKFKNAEFTITALPLDLQRIVLAQAMRAAIEVKDYAGAASRASELDVTGALPEQKPALAVLRGRLAEALGRDNDAHAAYREASASSDREAATEATLGAIALRRRHGDLGDEDALRKLETLAVTWRGDALEVRTLSMLMRLYADAGRYRDALAASRAATRLEPDSELARAGQDESAALFAQIFAGPKGDSLAPIDALAMFYEYQELTPIGRRGDEMIRRLSDRLVAVDLLDQASELLQYQVDQRLEGAARAQVAARLATVYLMNRKPERAIAALQASRINDLAGELRQQRLLLEARAQSDVGRRDFALDILTNVGGREAIRLRSDIFWAARRWRESSEQIELYYADRWRDAKPLTPAEKSDVVRAVVGYALAEDALGLARFREKYAPLMTAPADRATFEIASKPASAASADLPGIAKLAASVDTLEGFLREMRARFPDMAARTPSPAESKADPVSTGTLPKIEGRRADAAR